MNLNLAYFVGRGPTPGTVRINPVYVSSVYELSGEMVVVMSNGIGYHVEGTEEEVLAKLTEASAKP